MKKIVSVFLALSLSLSLLACGNSEDIVPTETEASVEASAESEVSIEASTETVSDASSVSNETVSESEETYPTLKDVFAEHNLKVGTCISGSMLTYPDQVAIIKDNFNSVTMENAMKPDAILNQIKSTANGEITVEFSKEAKTILEFAKENGLSMRGHTLVWYSQTPTWIFYEDYKGNKSLVSREVMLERMETLIKNTFQLIEDSGYTDLFYAYDVVNEAWMENGSMRENLWKQTIGDDYLWYAFYYANKYAPESIDLYYNDYNEQYKTQTLIDFVNTLVDEEGNYLIDGIGLQAHLYTGDSVDSYLKMIDKLSATGLKIEMTELDVCLGSWQNPGDANDYNLKKQGRYYYDLINGIFERVDAGTLNMDAITFWGFSDKKSWRREYSPLLYDVSMKPKYAYYGALQYKDLAGFE